MGKNSQDTSRKTKFQNKMRKRRRITFCILGIIICAIIFVSIKVTIKSNNEQELGSEKEEIESNKESIEQEKEMKEIVISAVGDCTFGQDDTFSYYGSFNNQIEKYNKDYSQFLKNVSDIFRSDDYTICNLETTFTDSKNKREKGDKVQYHFKASKECANILTSSSVEGVTVSNNHIYDYGDVGFKDTIETLNNNNIDYCGEGYKIIKEIKGVKIGFLGYTAWQNTQELKNKIVVDINELRNNGVKIIIPYFHWGIERQDIPCDVQKSIGRFAIDSGADFVLGSHSHVIQSLENYKGKLIVYSFGNFCFGGNLNPPDKNTFILQVKFNFNDNNMEDTMYKIIPCSISSKENLNDYTPTIISKDNSQNVINKINEISINFEKISAEEYFTLKNDE